MVSDLLAGLFFITIIYVLVRPQSKGIEFIEAFTGALAAIVSNATDLATEE